jgi:peptidoglycan/LPS O-acetylase OafA/YrhL
MRRYDIDWIRVIAIVLVLYFHVGMIFTAEWDWHIQNEERSNLVLETNFFLRQFRMPLLFLISGVGSWFAFRKRSFGQYIKERYHRLVIPLLFAMFFVVPPQVYLERLFRGTEYSSFLEFYPSVLKFIPYPQGNFSWHHMWFVLYLFLYSALAGPFFKYIRSVKGQDLKKKLLFFSGRNSIYILFLPSVAWYASVCTFYPSTNALVNDWGYFFYWFSFFVIGYIIACNEEMWQRLLLNRRTSLGYALLAIMVTNYLRWNGMEDNGLHIVIIVRVFASFSGWMLIYSILGYGQKYLNKASAILNYTNKGIYPFYIIHQTIIVILAFYVVPLEHEGIFFKYLFISTLSLFLSLAFYEFCVRPYRWTRYVFGVKE